MPDGNERTTLSTFSIMNHYLWSPLMEAFVPLKLMYEGA